MSRLVIVPEGTTWDNVMDGRLVKGSLRQLADADYVITADGRILKDRYLELEVTVFTRVDT